MFKKMINFHRISTQGVFYLYTLLENPGIIFAPWKMAPGKLKNKKNSEKLLEFTSRRL